MLKYKKLFKYHQFYQAGGRKNVILLKYVANIMNVSGGKRIRTMVWGIFLKNF